MRFRPNYNLTKYNTLRLNASTKYFTELTSISQLHSLSEFIQEKNCKYTVIGGGSNILLPEFYDGLIIHNKLMATSKILDVSDNTVIIKAMSGVEWDTFVDFCLCNRLYGLENLSGIPGSVGAAPIQNIGAYGVEVSEFIHQVDVYNFATRKIEILDNKDCLFRYRNSILKHNSKYMVISVTFKLTHTSKLNLSYPELTNTLRLHSTVSAFDLRNCVLKLRESKLPNPIHDPNVGSFFHNPIILIEDAKRLLVKYCELPIYKIDDSHCKLSAGWLIDNLALKGYRINDVMIYETHALIIVNKGKATQSEILSFANIIQTKVMDSYQIQLNIEPIVIK